MLNLFPMSLSKVFKPHIIDSEVTSCRKVAMSGHFWTQSPCLVSQNYNMIEIG